MVVALAVSISLLDDGLLLVVVAGTASLAGVAVGGGWLLYSADRTSRRRDAPPAEAGRRLIR